MLKRNLNIKMRCYPNLTLMERCFLFGKEEMVPTAFDLVAEHHRKLLAGMSLGALNPCSFLRDIPVGESFIPVEKFGRIVNIAEEKVDSANKCRAEKFSSQNSATDI